MATLRPILFLLSTQFVLGSQVYSCNLASSTFPTRICIGPHLPTQIRGYAVVTIHTTKATPSVSVFAMPNLSDLVSATMVVPKFDNLYYTALAMVDDPPEVYTAKNLYLLAAAIDMIPQSPGSHRTVGLLRPAAAKLRSVTPALGSSPIDENSDDSLVIRFAETNIKLRGEMKETCWCFTAEEWSRLMRIFEADPECYSPEIFTNFNKFAKFQDEENLVRPTPLESCHCRMMISSEINNSDEPCRFVIALIPATPPGDEEGWKSEPCPIALGEWEKTKMIKPCRILKKKPTYEWVMAVGCSKPHNTDTSPRVTDWFSHDDFDALVKTSLVKEDIVPSEGVVNHGVGEIWFVKLSADQYLKIDELSRLLPLQFYGEVEPQQPKSALGPGVLPLSLV